MNPPKFTYYKKIATLFEWLHQGRTIIVDGNEYGITEEFELLHIINEDKGVKVESIDFLYKIVNSLTDEMIVSMCPEIALTNMRREKAERRNKSITN